MTERKILFRGFHPDENGKTAIALNGEKIKGEWVYGSLISLLQGKFIVTTDYYNDVIVELHERLECNALWEDNDFVKVIPETVGQWVTTDKNGKDVFYDDYVKDGYGRIMKVVYKSYKPMLELVSYDKLKEWTNNFKFADLWAWFDDSVAEKPELIGNKWESEVTE